MVRTRSMGAMRDNDEAFQSLPEQTKNQQRDNRPRRRSGANSAELAAVDSDVEVSDAMHSSAKKRPKNEERAATSEIPVLEPIKTPGRWKREDGKGKMEKDLSPSPIKSSTRPSNGLYLWLNYIRGLVTFIFLNAGSILAYRVAIIYTAWIAAHWVATHLYSTYCVPKSFSGFFQSIAYSPTPVCSGLRWVIYNGGESISTAWLVVGGACLTQIRVITRIRGGPSRE